MTPNQVTLVQSSFEKVRPIADTAADIFYDRLFEIAPEARPLFPDDMREQKKKLMAMLGTVVANLGQLDTLLPAAEDLAVRHINYGAEDAHYPLVGSALIHTLSEGLGDDFDDPTRDAWIAAYTLLSEYMIEQAKKARS